MIDCETQLQRVEGAGWAREEPWKAQRSTVKRPRKSSRRVEIKGWSDRRENATQQSHMTTRFRSFLFKMDVEIAYLDQEIYSPERLSGTSEWNAVFSFLVFNVKCCHCQNRVNMNYIILLFCFFRLALYLTPNCLAMQNDVPTCVLIRQTSAVYVRVSKMMTLSYYPTRQNPSGLIYSHICRNIQRGQTWLGENAPDSSSRSRNSRFTTWLWGYLITSELLNESQAENGISSDLTGTGRAGLVQRSGQRTMCWAPFFSSTWGTLASISF